VWISDLDEIEKRTVWPTPTVRLRGKNRNQDTLPLSWPATKVFAGGVNLASCPARLIAAAYSALRAAASARAEGTARPFASTFTVPSIPGCTRQR
jgi:hypothetical protein